MTMDDGKPKDATGIYAALAAAMKDVKRVKKGDANNEVKYSFASIDDFLAMVGPICADHGLITIMDEDDVEFAEKPGKYGNTLWARIKYQITTYHISGEATPTVTRHVEVIRSGPQAYGSAQSYVLKQYYRGLLNIPTGDKDDPDFGTQPLEEVALKQQRQDPPKQQEQTKPQERDPSAIADGIIASFAKASTPEALTAGTAEGTRVAAAWDWLELEHKPHSARVKAAYDARMAALAPKPNGFIQDGPNPITPDKIPY